MEARSKSTSPSPTSTSPHHALASIGSLTGKSNAAYTVFGVAQKSKPQATNFKFGRYLHRVHPNKRPLIFWEKMECGRIQGLPQSF